MVSSRISEHEVDIFDFEAIQMTLQQPTQKKDDFVLTMRSLQNEIRNSSIVRQPDIDRAREE